MDLLKQLAGAGVVGAGGAGFPTHKKLDCSISNFIVNGAECEPLLETDKFIMRTMTGRVITGIGAALNQTGAKNACIVLKDKYTREAEKLQAEIEKQQVNVSLRFLSSFYPAGDEQVLVYEVLGKTVPPAGIPLAADTVVSNVCTMAWVADAARGIPVTRKLVTVAGEVSEPCIVDAPVGITVAKCIEAAGGVAVKKPWVILGGPMMGKYLPLKRAADMPVTKTTGGILIVDEDSKPVQLQRLEMRHIRNRAKSVCIQCSFCTEQCPRYLIGHPLHPHKMMRSIAFSGEDRLSGEECKEALLCSECGVCENYACPMELSPRRVNMYIKQELREQGIVYESRENHYEAIKEREFRRVATGRLTNRLGFTKYVFHAGDAAVRIETDEAEIPLKQHVGAPAVPVVKRGDYVRTGQLIGAIPDGSLGAAVHASIGGIVMAVGETIHISKDGTVRANA